MVRNWAIWRDDKSELYVRYSSNLRDSYQQSVKAICPQSHPRYPCFEKLPCTEFVASVGSIQGKKMVELFPADPTIPGQGGQCEQVSAIR